MRVLFVYKLKKPAVGYSHNNYTHAAVCVGIANIIFTMVLTTYQAELIELAGSCGSIYSEKQFDGFSDSQIRRIGETVLEKETESGFDLTEAIGFTIDTIEEEEKEIEDGINQADEYETIQ